MLDFFGPLACFISPLPGFILVCGVFFNMPFKVFAFGTVFWGVIIWGYVKRKPVAWNDPKRWR